MTAPADSAERAYESLAPFYDRFTEESDYEAWADTVEPLLQRHRPGATRLLDLACGTGESLLPFVRRGYDVTGSDLSGAMLEQARAKAPGVRLVQADMCALPPLGRFHVVTCFDDSLNYLCSPVELEAAFRSARRSLEPGGVFAFDLNTIAAYRRTFSADRVSGDRGLTFIWRGRSSPSAPAGSVAEASVDVLRPAGDGLFELIETRHRQRHHPPGEVEHLLARAGLEPVEIRGVDARGALVPAPDEEHLLKTLYVSRPVKGGE
jgi:SAM-dependent methyltransferase